MARNSETSFESGYQPLYEYPRHKEASSRRSSRLIAFLSTFLLIVVFSAWFAFTKNTFLTSSRPVQVPSAVRQIGELKVVDGVFVEPDLVSPPPTPGARLTKVRYGGFTVPPHTLTVNMIDWDVERPCTDCVVVAFQKGLEYANGTVANVDTGAYLHHDIQFHHGKPDTLCTRLIGERFSTSGNERWVKRLNAHGKWGFHLGGSNETWTAATRLQNLSDEEKVLYLTVSYEWLPLDAPEAEGYRDVIVLPLDIAPFCGNAEILAVKGQPVYNTKAWASTIRGHILEASGHMHGGGIGMSVYQNAKELCYSQALYGDKNGHVIEEGWVDKNGKEYISNVGICQNLGWLEIGDILTGDAKYDSDAHALDETDGVLDPVMGIMELYIGL